MPEPASTEHKGSHQAKSLVNKVLQRKGHCSETATSAEGPVQRKTQREVKISKPEMARKTIRSESVWKVANSLKAHRTFRNFQSTVEFRDVG
jgi:hypothetical protein